MENKKIKNATPLMYDGICFKSRLEVIIYKTLSQHGFKVYYEPTKYIIWKGFKPTIPFYTKDKKTRRLKLDNKKIIDITYTPDFIIEVENTIVIIEAKGFENDVFPYKKKLFRNYLETISKEGNQKILFFEIFTKIQMLQAIDIINEYIRSNKTIDTTFT